MSSTLSQELDRAVTGDGPAPELWGVMAEFATPRDAIHAAEHVRDLGFTRWDVHSPVPIHGMDEAMGLKRSRVSWVMGTMAFLGFSSAVAMQWWMSGVDYPMITAGKPYAAWEQFMPIMFELSVLFSAFGAVFGMLALNGLPMWYHPLLKKDRFLRVSDDRIVLVIEATDPKFSAQEARILLERLGGKHIDEVEA